MYRGTNLLVSWALLFVAVPLLAALLAALLIRSLRPVGGRHRRGP